MDFQTANPQDESYWFVKDEDGVATVVFIENIKSSYKTKDGISDYVASYTGVSGFYNAKKLDYIGLAFPITQDMVEKIKLISTAVTEQDLLSGKHFQDTIYATLITAAKYKNATLISVENEPIQQEL